MHMPGDGPVAHLCYVCMPCVVVSWSGGGVAFLVQLLLWHSWLPCPGCRLLLCEGRGWG
jgi:hypothetical protein